jgi:hypothetical protein
MINSIVSFILGFVFGGGIGTLLMCVLIGGAMDDVK